MTPVYADLARALIPEALVVLGALAVLGVDLSFLKRASADKRLSVAASVAGIAILAAFWAALAGGGSGDVFGGVLRHDALAFVTRLGVLVLALLVLGVVRGARPPRHPAEFVAILLFATTGFMLMGSAQQLLLAFLALEVSSLCLYILAAFESDRPESAEAALKYFLFGGMSSAFLLFGFSLLYGLTGSLSAPEIASALAVQGPSPLLSIALVMVLVGLGFKVAAAPFHFWAPDAYQGAPAPSAAVIASGSKLAGFALFIRLVWPEFGHDLGSGPGWIPTVAVLSGLSLLLGNLAALAQSNVRRLLAYSAIAHTGALLLGVIAAGKAGAGPAVYYAFTYALAAGGAFGVIAAVDRAGVCQRIDDLAGLYRRSPLLAGCLLIFILSLAGVPPLAGFFGKVSVFAAALSLDGLHSPAGWLALLAIFLSAVALYYYLIVLKQAFVAQPKSGGGPIATPPCAACALVGAALLTLLFGLAPSLILQFF